VVVAWLVLAVFLLAIGAWAFAHPDGGYRGAAGIGSSFSPGTRKVAGGIMTAVGALIVLAVLLV